MKQRIHGLLALLTAVCAALTMAACGENTAEVSSLPDTLPLPSGLQSSASGSPAESNDATSNTTTSDTVTSTPEVESVSSETPNYSNYTYYTENSANAPDIHNITVRTEKNLYTTSLTALTVTVQNRTGWEMMYANEYKMERKSGDGWVEMSVRSDEEFHYVTQPLSNNQDGTVTLDLTRLNETLSVGTYRVSLPMICNGYAGTFYRSAEFTVK